jgi:Transposase DDE domain
MAPKKDATPPKKKDKYRIRNWKQYNQSLVNRGSITFWFDENATEKWYSVERPDKPGRPDTYSDDAIRCGLLIKSVFRTALRALQGFIGSLIKIMGLDLVCPHYSVFSRRAKGLQIPLRRLLKPGEKLNVVFDSTGVKVFGEGEWKVRKHGYSKRRTWRKVHVGMCVDSGQVVVSAMTSNNVSDDEAMIYMMEALEGIPLGDVLGDGAYDTVDCREAVYDRGGRQVIPPDKNAKLQRRAPLPALEERDQAIRRIQERGDEGRALWKQEIGYHRRSRVETLMYRYKTVLGDRLTARKDRTQATEVAIKLDVLNRMTELGMPKSYKVTN